MANTNIEKQARTFCKVHLGKHCFAPFTGQDNSAWSAFVYLLEMYSRGDEVGRESAISGMRACLRGCQNTKTVHELFAQAIPAVLDWGDADRIWPQLQSRWDVRPVQYRYGLVSS